MTFVSGRSCFYLFSENYYLELFYAIVVDVVGFCGLLCLVDVVGCRSLLCLVGVVRIAAM